MERRVVEMREREKLQNSKDGVFGRTKAWLFDGLKREDTGAEMVGMDKGKEEEGGEDEIAHRTEQKERMRLMTVGMGTAPGEESERMSGMGRESAISRAVEEQNAEIREKIDGARAREGEREMAGDGVRVVDAETQRAQAIVEVGVPDRLAPLHPGGAPDVVDEDVEAPAFGLDPANELANLVGRQVVDLDGDAASAGLVDELGRLLDGLGPVVVGRNPSGTATATGANNGCARFTQRRGDAPPGTSCRPDNDGHATTQ